MLVELILEIKRSEFKLRLLTIKWRINSYKIKYSVILILNIILSINTIKCPIYRRKVIYSLVIVSVKWHIEFTMINNDNLEQ